MEKKNTHVVISLDGRPVAVGFLERDLLEIRAILVDQEYRRYGYGSEVVRQLEQIARECGLHRVIATVESNNSHAMKMFEKLGYHKLVKYEKWI